MAEQRLGNAHSVLEIVACRDPTPRSVLVCIRNGEDQGIDLHHDQRLHQVAVDGIPHPRSSGFDFEVFGGAAQNGAPGARSAAGGIGGVEGLHAAAADRHRIVIVGGNGGDGCCEPLIGDLGATIGGDAEVLESAERETRASGDRSLLLEVLHASGSAAHQREAHEIATAILEHVPPALRTTFLAQPQVQWAGLR